MRFVLENKCACFKSDCCKEDSIETMYNFSIVRVGKNESFI